MFNFCIASKIPGIQNFVDESERISHKGQADRRGQATLLLQERNTAIQRLSSPNVPSIRNYVHSIVSYWLNVAARSVILELKQHRQPEPLCMYCSLQVQNLQLACRLKQIGFFVQDIHVNRWLVCACMVTWDLRARLKSCNRRYLRPSTANSSM